MLFVFVFLVLFYLGFIALLIISMWKIFEKAGQPGWAALIPIYSFVILLRIVGKPEWWVVLLFVPIANYIIIIWTYNMLSKSFGHSEGYTVGLLLLGFVFLPILAFSKDVYQGPFGDPYAYNEYQSRLYGRDIEQIGVNDMNRY